MKTILTHSFVLTLLSLTLSSCAEKPSDFAAFTTSAITSDGSGSENTKITEVQSTLCSQATEQISCEKLGDGCQGEFNEVNESNNEMTFIKCIPKVEVEVVADVLYPLPLENKEPTDIGMDEVSDVLNPLPLENKEPVASVCEFNLKLPEVADVRKPLPLEIEEPIVASPIVALPTSCKDVPKKFLIDDGHGQPKVRICHRHENEKEVTLRIACPALKAHLSDKHSDYLGECRTLGTDN